MVFGHRECGGAPWRAAGLVMSDASDEMCVVAEEPTGSTGGGWGKRSSGNAAFRDGNRMGSLEFLVCMSKRAALSGRVWSRAPAIGITIRCADSCALGAATPDPRSGPGSCPPREMERCREAASPLSDRCQNPVRRSSMRVIARPGRLTARSSDRPTKAAVRCRRCSERQGRGEPWVCQWLGTHRRHECLPCRTTGAAVGAWTAGGFRWS